VELPYVVNEMDVLFSGILTQVEQLAKIQAKEKKITIAMTCAFPNWKLFLKCKLKSQNVP